MGLMDNIRGFFSRSKDNNQTFQPEMKVNEEYEKERLSNSIINSVDKIKRINSFDSSIWNLSNISTYDLQRKSLNELKNLDYTLKNRIVELTKQNLKSNVQRESLEASKWTGNRPKEMSEHDFDVFQRSDDR